MSEQAALRFTSADASNAARSQNKLTDISTRTYEKWHLHRQQNVMGAGWICDAFTMPATEAGVEYEKVLLLQRDPFRSVKWISL
jgi:hypothetical protein